NGYEVSSWEERLVGGLGWNILCTDQAAAVHVNYAKRCFLGASPSRFVFHLCLLLVTSSGTVFRERRFMASNFNFRVSLSNGSWARQPRLFANSPTEWSPATPP